MDKYCRGVQYLTEIHEQYGFEMFQGVVQEIWNAGLDADSDNLESFCLESSFLEDEDIKAAGSLFQMVTPSGYAGYVPGCSPTPIGCLTEIRQKSFKSAFVRNPQGFCAVDCELTQEIRKDERIPVSPDQITLESLPVFVEWQRRLDKEVRSKKVRSI